MAAVALQTSKEIEMKPPPDLFDPEPQMTRHATARLSERKVSDTACRIIMRHADLIRPSRGLQRLRISRRVARDLDTRNIYERRDIENARESELLASSDGSIVTVLRHEPDVRFRRMGRRATRQKLWRKWECEQ